MQIKFSDRLKHAWNIFKSRDPTDFYPKAYGYGGDAYRPDYNRRYNSFVGDRSIVTAIKNRIAVDAAQVDIQHVRLDDNGRYLELIPSGLNKCLSLGANIDQTGRAFRLDIFMSLLDEGVIAIVPVDTDIDPDESGSFKIESMRVGKIVQWYPQHVSVSLYNEKTGLRQEVMIPKKFAAIVENPFYSVMNEPNSTFQRLIHKLGLLDSVDEQSSSGKLDLIIQLPYVVKTATRKEQAEARRKEIEEQLNGTKYGIAYTDGTEKIQQLNRPLENNLLSQIQYLTDLAFSQLGMTKEIMNGTADERAMLNYNNRIIEPLIAAVADSMKRTFLTQTAITQKQSIEYFRDPFALVPVDNVADIADKFTRNEIMTSNEIRQIIGMKPSSDPNADVLRNKNLYDTTGPMPGNNTVVEENNVEVDEPLGEEEIQNELDNLDLIDDQLDELEELTQSDDDDFILHYADPAKRREYYYKYEKENRKKGRDHSTAGLNEEGREYARYIRETLSQERKDKVASSKVKQDSGIALSKDAMNLKIETSKNARDTLRDSINSGKDARIGASKDRMAGNIEASKSARDKTIEASKAVRDQRIESTNAQRDSDIEAQRSTTKNEIESHKNQMEMKIQVLRDALSNMSKEERAARKDEIQGEIKAIRAENSAKREALREELKTASGAIREKAKSDNTAAREEHRQTSTAAREEHKKTSTEAREEHKAESTKARETAKEGTSKVNEAHKAKTGQLRGVHKDVSSKLREAHKENTARAKEEYEEEYERNLEYIKSLPEYQAAKKGSSSSESKPKSTEIAYSKNPNFKKKK